MNSKLEKIKARAPILFYTGCFVLFYAACCLTLMVFDLRFRYFITKVWLGIIVLGVVIGIFQVIWRFKDKALRNFCLVVCIVLIVIKLPIIAIVGSVYFVTSNETTEVKDGVKYSVYEEVFLDTFTDYYIYVNPIVSKRKASIKEKDHYIIEVIQEDGTYKMVAGFGG